MLSRIWPIGLVLCALLTSNVYGAQYQTDSIRGAAVSDPAKAPVFQDVAVMWLYVVKDGKITKLSYNAEKLSKTPVLSVDGYVNGVVLLSTDPLDIAVNNKPMNPIDSNKEGYFDLKYFGYLNSDDFWSTFLSVDAERNIKGKIKGRYSSFPKVPGDMLCRDSEFRISFQENGFKHFISVRQDSRIKLPVYGTADNVDGPELYYLGDNLNSFRQTPDFNRRLEALLSGIQSIEKVMSGKIVEQVHIIDYEGPHNAYTCAGQNEIWLYSGIFRDERVDELRIIAQHETMHIVSDRLELSKSSRMRELFAELLGYDIFSRDRFFVMATGRPPGGKPMRGASPNSALLFDFINEINFIRGMNGGHSKDNLDEFCASFLHTLVYIDRFDQMLKQPVKLSDGSIKRISTDDRNKLQADYEKVLQAIAGEIKADSQLVSFFNTCRVIAERACRIESKESNPGLLRSALSESRR